MESPKSENILLMDESRLIDEMHDTQSNFLYILMGITTTVFSILLFGL